LNLSPCYSYIVDGGSPSVLVGFPAVLVGLGKVLVTDGVLIEAVGVSTEIFVYNVGIVILGSEGVGVGVGVAVGMVDVADGGVCVNVIESVPESLPAGSHHLGRKGAGLSVIAGSKYSLNPTHEGSLCSIGGRENKSETILTSDETLDVRDASLFSSSVPDRFLIPPASDTYSTAISVGESPTYLSKSEYPPTFSLLPVNISFEYFKV